MIQNRGSFRLAFCGLIAALMAVIMLLGPLLPASSYACPALAGLFLIPVIWEFGTKTGLVLYLAVSLLSLILTPSKEAALCFALLFGWYPLARPRLQHLKRKPVRAVLKAVLFNGALAVIYVLLLFVFVMPEESQEWTWLLAAGFLILGNVCFFLYDFILGRLGELYVYRLRPKLFPRQFHSKH